MTPEEMFTVMKIPTQRAPEDPSWVVKKKSGRRLDPVEYEEYFKNKYDEEFTKLINEKSFEGVPSHAQLISSIRTYHVFKKKCLVSFFDC